MKSFEKDRFAKILGSVAILCGAEINEAVVDAYWKFLSLKFENIDEFQKAAERVVENWKIVNTFPPAAVFLEHKVDKIDLEIIAQKAWESVVKAIEAGVGYTKVAEFEDELIPAVVALCGGFENLASKSYEELEWIKKEFIKTYKNAVNGDVKLQKQEVRAILKLAPKLKIKANYPVLKAPFNLQIANNLVEEKAKELAKLKVIR